MSEEVFGAVDSLPAASVGIVKHCVNTIFCSYSICSPVSFKV